MADDLPASATPVLPVSATPVPSQDHLVRLSNSLKNAETLLEHAAKFGRDIPEHAIPAIIDLRDQLKAGTVPKNTEETFWKQYTLLSRAMLPATVEGIEETRSDANGFLSYAIECVKRPFQGQTNSKKKPPAAYVSAFWYMVVAIVLLMAVVFIQISATYGTALVQDATELNAKLKATTRTLERQQSQRETLTPQLNQAKDNSEEKANLGVQLKVLNSEIETWQNNQISIQEAEEATMSLLRIFNSPLDQWLGQTIADSQKKGDEQKAADDQRKADNKPRDDDPYRAIERARLTLLAINGFILPFFIGALGAAAFVLRSLAKDIRDDSFSPESQIQYRLRLALGPLAGVAIGLLVVPEAVSLAPLLVDPSSLAGTSAAGQTAAGAAAAASSNTAPRFPIGPLALPFLVGYSVDFFFSIADRVLESFKIK
jgi:cell division protein FtsB